MVRIIETRQDAPANVLVLELEVISHDGGVRATVVPLAGLFEAKSGLVEQMYLYALDLCNHHKLLHLWINDAENVFPPDVRPKQPSRRQLSSRRKTNPETKDLRSSPLTPESLIWFDFQHIGFWQARPEAERLQLRGQVDGRPGVYIFVVENNFRFVGAAHGGLRQRMEHYASSGTSSSALRIRHAIREELNAGRSVHVLAKCLTPSIRDIEGLPFDMVAGLQGGLHRILQPPWNKLGESF